MPTYFDPIALDDECPITEKTFIYLIKLNGMFAIKGISCNPQQLSKDPTSSVLEYRFIDTKVLLDHAEEAELFPDNKLTSERLSCEKIQRLLGINPDEIPVTSFNSALQAEFRSEWVDQVMQDLNVQNPNVHTPRRDVDALSVMRLTRSRLLNFSFFGRISNQRTETAAAADRARLFP